ncbi:hypothetical protein [Aureimonas sp. AU40]|uniref:hypothetical protein n=1 Tax=Aureimonas sp. AU40 TaxID=1637747 RepID=UPI000B02060D|nr:hypothetical protein [Aureimonas sp. AU40]
MPVLVNSTAASQTIAAAGTSAVTAPARSIGKGTPLASVRCGVDAWVAFGATPNAAADPRRFLPANTTEHFFVEPGDKVAWTAA